MEILFFEATLSVPLLVKQESSKVFTCPVVRLALYEIYQTMFYINWMYLKFLSTEKPRKAYATD